MMPSSQRVGASRPPPSTVSAVRRGTQFGLTDEDADDFYDVVMSSDDEDDVSDADNDNAVETARNTSLNAASQPQDEAERLAALSLNDTDVSTSSAIMRHIGSISYSAASDRSAASIKPSTIQSGDEEFVLTEEELQSHSKRRSALEIALDAATRSPPLATDAGEAPFRFAAARGKPVTSPAPSSSVTPSAGNAPQQSESAKRKPGMPLGGVNEELDSDDEELSTEPDPLYDDAMDDADEKWVQTNLRGEGASGSKTDATLCCPCCFVTVCMDCQRHVKYINQYRARAAMNCRVKKDEILTYAKSGADTGPSRQQLSSMTKRHATGAAALLGKDEYFGVVCSDCGTVVGVYDAQQDYHFFNILPSNC